MMELSVASQEHEALLSSDEGGGSSDERTDSSEDEVTEHVPVCQPDMATARAQVPTISVTPHSPGVLDDSLQQLRRLHAAVQRMRAAPLPLLSSGTSRLSTSCPSLSKDAQEDCSSPTHLELYPASRKGSGESRQWPGWQTRDDARRSSWAALEPAPIRTRSNLNGHSGSLSSMESDGEVPRPHARHSTHSLNDNDLAKDFAAVSALALGLASPPLGRVPLHKSISTPSIANAQPSQPVHDNVLGSVDTDSQSDEESRHTAIANNTLTAHYNKAVFDHHAEKRRKRGSLFFRKKKDKSRKAAAHTWQAAATGGDCDWCNRALSDKPALFCENCNMTVHQNLCKDSIVECNKPKISKAVGKSLSTSSGKSKRSSVSGQHSTSKKLSGCYSPWRRVATKLGVHTSHLCDDKDGSDHKHDHSNAWDDSGNLEWNECFLTGDQLGEEANELGLAAVEAETWAVFAPKGLNKTLGERETKRQEHIYELILTEKHHCLTIRLMQKMFCSGLIRSGYVSDAQCNRMFPCIAELWGIHSWLLNKLRQRQKANPRVPTVADILAEAFSPPRSDMFKKLYGEFCARHRDAVEVFKDLCLRQPNVARFVSKCQQNPLLRKKGVPECVLFVAQRLTKYPLLLEPLLKTAGEDQNERDLLQKALRGVKEILVDVDNQVACVEREERKLQMYHRIDAKSFATFRGRKFKKSDILMGNRSLKFEGVATLMQGRSKMQTLLVIVLTDVLFFLHDNNNKYTFFTPDNKTGVVSLSKLLVREKAGEGRGLYLICSWAKEPEMFELRVHRPKDIRQWIQAIRAAVQNCPDELAETEANYQANSAEEKQRQLEARQENIRQITEALRSKDRDHAAILEDKMSLHMKMLAHTGNNTTELSSTGVNSTFPGGLVFPDYIRLSAPTVDTHALWQEVCKVVKDSLELSSMAWLGSVNLGRSTSSAGERTSSAYVSPALPRRADTFAGFDHRAVNIRPASESSDLKECESDIRPVHEQIGSDAAFRLQHAVYTLTCIVWQQLTTIHSLEAQVVAWRSWGGAGSVRLDSQLEELRDAQAKLTQEKALFNQQRNEHMHSLDAERQQLAAARQELREQQKDVEQQRERLYRRLERLQQHGGSQEEIASVGTLSPDTSVSDNTRRKEPKWRSGRGSTGSESSVPPVQLLSARNETKATARQSQYGQMVKQQLPLKLASGKSVQPASASTPSGGYSRLHESPSEQHSQVPVVHHTRTGSSPAPMTSQTHHTNNKATRTNTYPKLPDKFRVRSPEPPQPQPPQQEEEVIYF